MIETFKLFEFNRYDKKFLIENADDLFTIAVEFELETTRKEVPFKFTSMVFDNMRKAVTEILNEKGIRLNPRRMKYVEYLISGYYHSYNKDNFDDFEENVVLDDEKLLRYDLDRNKEKEIKDVILGIMYLWDEEGKLEEFEDTASDKITETVNIFNESFPNFIKKWGGDIKNMKDNPDDDHPETKVIGDLKFMIDGSLAKGIEMANTTYVNGLTKSIEFIRDFFEEYNKQKDWKFTYNTGLHINIGVTDKNVKWNVVKGVVMISDYTEKKTPYVFKNQEDRQLSIYTNSVIKSLKEWVDKIDINFRNQDDVENIENILNKKIVNMLDETKYGRKKFGFSLYKIINFGYNEFRYLGGENVTEELISDKIMYFAYITYLMYDEEYKKREYYKKLYKVLDYLKV